LALIMVDVVVVGGSNIDIKAKASAHNRLGTSNPGHVVTTPGGVARNIAHNLSCLGDTVSLISVIGNDMHGRMIMEHSLAARIELVGVEVLSGATGSYVALLDSNGELVSAVNDMRIIDRLTPEMLLQHRPAINAARLVIADCNLPLATLQALAALAGHKLIVEPVSVEKSEKLFALLANHQLFLATPNLDQIEALTGTRDLNAALETLHGRGLGNVIIHLGVEGALASDGQNIELVPAASAGPVIDVTGAGDAAVAGLTHGLLQKLSLFDAARLGQTMAGRVIASAQSTLGQSALSQSSLASPALE
jgi:pseudouridine kinase